MVKDKHIEYKKAISTLIVTVLLVAVSVVVISLLLNWSVNYIEERYEDIDDSAPALASVSAENYIFNGNYNINNITLTFSYTPPSSYDKTIVIDKVFIVGYEDIIDVDNVTLNQV